MSWSKGIIETRLKNLKIQAYLVSHLLDINNAAFVHKINAVTWLPFEVWQGCLSPCFTNQWWHHLSEATINKSCLYSNIELLRVPSWYCLFPLSKLCSNIQNCIWTANKFISARNLLNRYKFKNRSGFTGF